MKCLGLSILFFFSCYMGVYAQALVRSGEHESFSRIVVYVSDAQDWELVKSEEGFRFTLEGWNAGFDASTVFDRMPRTRVASVASTDSDLLLDLNCDCVARAERVAGVGVIVDIREGPAVNAAVDNEDIASPPPIIFEDVGREEPTLNLIDLSEEEAVNPALDAFRKSLFEGLGRSATLSLVDIEQADRVRDDKGASQDQAIDLGETADDGRIRVTTALETALNANNARSDFSKQKQCPPMEYFSIHNWGTENEFGTQVSELRRSILGEFDSVDSAKVQQLARLYLYFGLGTEARSLMTQFDIPAAQKDIILDLADILEPEFYRSRNIALRVSGCGAETVPWSVLVKAEGDAVTENEAIETTAQFARWPRHLQELLGPKLISTLSASDRAESVEVLKNLLSRQSGELPQAVELAAAKHSISSSQSLEGLLEIVESGTDESAAALALYLDKSLQEGSPFDEGLIELASAFAEELKGTELSVNLTNLKVEALAAKGRVLDAIDTIGRAKSKGWTADEHLADKLTSHVLRSENQQLIAQLSIFLANSNVEFGISEENQVKLSSALVDMGLPVLARQIYASDATSENFTKIAAELAIASGELDEAIELLGNSESPDQTLDQRRTEMLIKSGRALEAWETRRANMPDEDAARLAWFAQRWEAVDPSGTEGRVAALITKELESDLDTQPLTSAQELNENSANTRSALRELLQNSEF